MGFGGFGWWRATPDSPQRGALLSAAVNLTFYLFGILFTRCVVLLKAKVLAAALASALSLALAAAARPGLVKGAEGLTTGRK